MLGIIRAMIFGAAIVAAETILVIASTESHAETGTVRLNFVRAGLIIGVGGARGTLTFHGRRYRLSVGGVSLDHLFAGAELVGTVYNLHSASDIAGKYAAAGDGNAITGGGQVVRLQNANGVVFKVNGPKVGTHVSFNLAGMTIALR